MNFWIKKMIDGKIPKWKQKRKRLYLYPPSVPKKRCGNFLRSSDHQVNNFSTVKESLMCSQHFLFPKNVSQKVFNANINVLRFSFTLVGKKKSNNKKKWCRTPKVSFFRLDWSSKENRLQIHLKYLGADCWVFWRKRIFIKLASEPFINFVFLF